MQLLSTSLSARVESMALATRRQPDRTSAAGCAFAHLVDRWRHPQQLDWACAPSPL